MFFMMLMNAVMGMPESLGWNNHGQYVQAVF